MKSYRLYAWSRELKAAGGLRLRLLDRGVAMLRFFWRWFTFAPLVAFGLGLIAFVPVRLDGFTRGLAITCAFTLVVGSIGIAAEGVFACLQMRPHGNVGGSWATMHHAWPAGRDRATHSRQKEFSLYYGSYVICAICSAALFAPRCGLATRTATI